MHIFFRTPFFWHPDKLPKNICEALHTICVFFKTPKKHNKTGKTSKQSWTDFQVNLGQIFSSRNAKSWTDSQLYSIYAYIYICCGVIIWSKFGLFNSYCLVQVCLSKTHSKIHIKIGVAAFLCLKTIACKKRIVTIWSKLAFFLGHQLGPDNKPYLDQIRTIINGHFSFVCFWTCANIPIYSVFWTSTKICQKEGSPKR